MILDHESPAKSSYCNSLQYSKIVQTEFLQKQMKTKQLYFFLHNINLKS